MKVTSTLTVKIEHDDGTFTTVARSAWKKDQFPNKPDVYAMAEAASLNATRDCLNGVNAMHR